MDESRRLEAIVEAIWREENIPPQSERDDYLFTVEVALRRALWRAPNLSLGPALFNAVRDELGRMAGGPPANGDLSPAAAGQLTR